MVECQVLETDLLKEKSKEFSNENQSPLADYLEMTQRITTLCSLQKIILIHLRLFLFVLCFLLFFFFIVFIF